MTLLDTMVMNARFRRGPKADKAAGIDEVSTPNLTIQKQLAALAALLLHLIDDQGPMVLHITASRSGEGVTTIARALAATVACVRLCNVALIDATQQTTDRSLPDLMQSSELAPTLTLQRQHVAGCDIGIGVLGHLGATQPTIERMRGLYSKLRSEYALTIVDCPPVALFPDTAMFAKLADGTLLVVAAEQTRVAEIEQTRALLGRFDATVLGVVLNKQRTMLPHFLESWLS